jgi:hypothetical protein
MLSAVMLGITFNYCCADWRSDDCHGAHLSYYTFMLNRFALSLTL